MSCHGQGGKVFTAHLMLHKRQKQFNPSCNGGHLMAGKVMVAG